jgi:molecular chaperone GrpE
VTHDQNTSRAAAEEAAAQSAEPEATTDGVHAAVEPEAEEPELAAAREMAAESEGATASTERDAPAPVDAPASAERDAPAAADGPASEPDADAAASAEPDYQDKWLRAVAEVDNIRKRARRDVAAAESRGIAKLARELLPALDNFERALAAAEAQPENRDHHLTDGIRLVQTELLGALARVGIVPDSPKGERFDPHRHEAVAQQPADGADPGTIIEVYSAGYTYGDDVLRPAKVVVAG